MLERLRRQFIQQLPRRPLLVLVGACVGFVAVVGAHLQSPSPESRLPAAYRLAALIKRQQAENNQARNEVAALRGQIQTIESQSQNQQAGVAAQSKSLADAGLLAQTTELKGVGFVVRLDDSSLKSAPTGNVNDLVIHSHDVQAVVNGLWTAGANAIAVNGARLVSTSAVICVGNTLLINGTVYSPPYEIASVGADKQKFEQDALVKNLHADADRFSLRFDIGREQTIAIPAYVGPTELKYARINGQ